MANKLGIAIAGTGFGEKYAAGLKAYGEVELLGVFSRRPERAKAMAEQFDIPFWTRNYDELLDLPGLDAVAVVTPNSTHAEFIRDALRACKHVICDKPLALNAAEAAELYTEAEAARVKHVTFVPYRFSPASVAMKQAMTEGTVGRVIRVKTSWAVDLREEPLRWRFQRKLSGAGVVADLGAHMLDLMMWWAGPIRRVLGRCQTMVKERPAEAGGRMREVDVPDECWALLEFANAGVGSAALSWNATRDQLIEIEGDRGKLTYQSPSLLQWLSDKGPFKPTASFALSEGKRTELPLPDMKSFAKPDQALAKMFGEIISYLQGAEKPDCVATFHDGTKVLEVIDTIEQSSESGAWLDLSRYL